jgi:hypothetical protein
MFSLLEVIKLKVKIFVFLFYLNVDGGLKLAKNFASCIIKNHKSVLQTNAAKSHISMR